MDLYLSKLIPLFIYPLGFALVVATAVHRMEQGNFSNVKGVGAGVYEYRIDFGPGYRIYFGKDGDRLVILLAGGTKKRQDADITAAKSH